LLGKRDSTGWNDDQGSAGRHLSFLLAAPSTDAVILGAQILILGVRGWPEGYFHNRRKGRKGKTDSEVGALDAMARGNLVS